LQTLCEFEREGEAAGAVDKAPPLSCCYRQAPVSAGMAFHETLKIARELLSGDGFAGEPRKH
jgi:hypothetical protein